MKDINGYAPVANRVASWVAIIAIGIYVMDMGKWVGAADEKLADAEKVEEQVDAIMQRITAVEVVVAAQTETMKENKEDILRAINDLKDEIRN
jgi:2-methylisocitrate lyase-like PEP mutase family enzyme